MKKNDFILITLLLIAAAAIYLICSVNSKNDNSIVQVLIDGKEKGSYSLYKDGEYRIETKYGYNILLVKDKTASVKEASCHDRTCVHSSTIAHTGESIICLPNRLVIKIIEKNNRSGLDGMAQ